MFFCPTKSLKINECQEPNFDPKMHPRTMNAVLTGSQLGGRTMNMLCTVGSTQGVGVVFVREVSREGLKVCKVNCWEKVLGRMG